MLFENCYIRSQPYIYDRTVCLSDQKNPNSLDGLGLGFFVVAKYYNLCFSSWLLTTNRTVQINVVLKLV